MEVSDPRSLLDVKNQINHVLSSLEQLEREGEPRTKAELEKKLEKIKKETSEVLDGELSKCKEDFEHKMGQIIKNFSFQIENNSKELKRYLKNKTKNHAPPKEITVEKVHRQQSPPISKLLYDKDFKTLYNISIAILINIGIGLLLKDLIDYSNLEGYALMSKQLGNFYEVCLTLVFNFFVSVLCVPLVQLYKKDFKPLVLIPIFLILQFTILGTGVVSIVRNQTPIASSFIVVLESFRMTMKNHSYFREKLLYGKGPNQYQKFVPDYAKQLGLTQDQVNTPQINIESATAELSRFLYFFFVPTLIYRDSYPRLKGRMRFNNILIHTFNFIGTIVYTGLIFKAFCIPEFQHSAEHMKETKALVILWASLMLPSMMIFLLIFFGVTHAWFCIFAEVLGFADRGFYSDWWNSRDFLMFYRKFSVIIYDWAHTYVFVDIMRFTNNTIGQRGARAILFCLLGCIIECIVDLSLGVFSVVLVLLISITGISVVPLGFKFFKSSNVLVWVIIIMTNGLIMTLYSLEYYSLFDKSTPSPYQEYGLLGIFIPKWTLKLFS